MRVRHPALETLEVADRGHAPPLAEADAIARIVDFAARYDAGSMSEPITPRAP